MDERILLVDDEQVICELMTMAFTRIGCQVITAAYAKEAIGVAKTEGFRDCLMKPISFPVLFQAAQAAFTPQNCF